MGGTNGATSEVTHHTHAAAINEQARAKTRKETAQRERERERGGMCGKWQGAYTAASLITFNMVMTMFRRQHSS